MMSNLKVVMKEEKKAKSVPQNKKTPRRINI